MQNASSSHEGASEAERSSGAQKRPSLVSLAGQRQDGDSELRALSFREHSNKQLEAASECLPGEGDKSLRQSLELRLTFERGASTNEEEEEGEEPVQDSLGRRQQSCEEGMPVLGSYSGLHLADDAQQSPGVEVSNLVLSTSVCQSPLNGKIKGTHQVAPHIPACLAFNIPEVKVS